jgi:hypothetical protein
MGDVDQEDRAQLERLVGAAMEIARERTGLTREDWVRRLRPALRLPDATPEMKLRNNWYAWRSKPWTVPAVLLLAAASAAGMTLEALLAAAAESLADAPQRTGFQRDLPAAPSAEGRLARLEREVAEQQRVIDELREEIDRRSAPASNRDEERRRAGR